MKNTSPQNTDWETKITAIDPNDYSTITEENFIGKYGKAAEKLIKQIKDLSYKQGREDMRKEICKMITPQSYETPSASFGTLADIEDFCVKEKVIKEIK